MLEKETEIPAAVWLGAFDRELPGLRFIDEETIAYQQQVADVFYSLALIPEKLDIASVAWFGDKVATK